MKHILFGSDLNKLTTALLIKTNSFNKNKIFKNYLAPLKTVAAESVIAFNLPYQLANKCTAAFGKEYLNEVLPEIDKLGIKTIVVCDAIYFKFLTKNTKAEPFYGYVCSCTIPKFEHMQVILAPNYTALVYNPVLYKKIELAIQTWEQHLTGTYEIPGKDIFHSEWYPETVLDITNTLNSLYKCKSLTCDIETTGLEFYSCGLSTISFAWDKHNGTAFAIDRGNPKQNAAVRAALKKFLINYQGTLIYHNAGYDIKVLVFELWMDHLADYKNMLDGIFTLTNSFEDTKLIAYAATNNAVKNTLGLKQLAAEFTGNYAEEDIKDTTKILLPDLLKYNLEDCLATWYVFEKYYPIMVQDTQEKLYKELFKPTVRTLLQMEMCGLPIDPVKVKAAKKQLTDLSDKCKKFFKTSKIIQDFHFEQLTKKAEKFTAKAKKKIYTIEDSVIKEDFNPNSDKQLRDLLYDYLNYPVIDYTKSKAPAVGGKTIKKLQTRILHKDHEEIFENLISLSEVTILLTTFIPAFEKAQQLQDGTWRLYGNFNLGGTQSLRLCVSGDTQIATDCGLICIENIVKNQIPCKVLTHKNSYQKIIDYYYKGIEEMYEVTLESGRSIKCTLNHVFYTNHGWLSLNNILQFDKEVKIYEIA